jgi:hypothetical protein
MLLSVAFAQHLIFPHATCTQTVDELRTRPCPTSALGFLAVVRLCSSWHADTPHCGELPTVEECRAAAQVITHPCLRQCVEKQCAGINVNCDSEEIKKNCKGQNSEGLIALGYVVRFSDRPTSCDDPSREVNWCEQPSSRDCRAKSMVHELAHSCGWRHNQGLGVPGDDGRLLCE